MISDTTRAEIERLTRTLPGWCSLAKAVTLADLVLVTGAETVVEIGLFGGRSFFPMALALKQQGRGRAYGIEAYSNAIAVETPTNEVNDAWWAELDIGSIKRTFLAYLLEAELENHAALVELASDDAYAAFATPRFAGLIDIVHIDGSHSPEQSLRDLQRWSGLLRPSGYIIADDIGWPSLADGRAWLTETHQMMTEVFAGGESYGVYRKHG
jgi:predicted O-methyltransferase YrrM